MTALIKNNQITNNIITPIKVALVGVTMIQQSLLEFYFATQEGLQKYKLVLGKDADAYITNFDELGSIEAWENLYAQEDKPTLVLSNRHEIINNYIYIPKPITPQALADAVISIQHLLGSTVTSKRKMPAPPSDEFLQFSTDPSTLSMQKDSTLPLDKTEEVMPPVNNRINDELSSEKEENSNNSSTEFEFDFINEISAEKISDEPKLVEGLNEKEVLDKVRLNAETVSSKKLDNEVVEKEINKELEFDQLMPLEEFTVKSANNNEPSSDNNQTTNHEEDIFAGLDMLDDLNLDDNIAEKNELSFEPSLIDNKTSDLATKAQPLDSDEDISSPDELQHFLDELNEKGSLQEKEKKASNHSKKKSKQQMRWRQLCGEYTNDNYKKDSDLKTSFKLEETLLPYLVDTIAFTQRAACWMELAYKPLSILINPENQLIYSNLSVNDPLFVQICSAKTIEELIEFLEVDSNKIEQINNNQQSNQLFSYEITSFLWTVSLLVSYGRLPEGVDPDKKISITNWLSLNKVEKFPYIMQIAAVFNRQHASLNETAAWLTLPKRYVYAFYNGVAALNMIENNPEKLNKKKMITMTNDAENDGGIKNLLFKKII